MYFAAFSAQRDKWNPTASREKRIDKRRNILSDKSVNGLSPRADEATTPEENTTNPKMPTQTNKGQHPEDEKETLKKNRRRRAGSGRAKNGYGSVPFHAVIRQQLEIEGITQSSYNSNRAKTPRALCDKSTESCIF